MSLRTKLITYPTILAIAVVLGIWLQTSPNGDDRYVLSVTWSPAALPMGQVVSFMVSVDGFTLSRPSRRLSPWSETMSAAPGVEVVLTAVSNYSGTQMLDCMIMRNSRSIGPKAHDKRDSPGTVTCSS